MRNKQTIVITSLLIACIVILSYFTYRQIVTNTILSEQQIATRVEALYGGDVQTIEKSDTQYSVTFALNDAIYEVLINEEYGTLEQLTLIKEGSKIPAQEPATSNERLTKQQIIAIAQKEATGKVEDVTFYSNADGGYYLIEIERDDEDVMLQIHAITGKILSVSFDD